MTNEELRQTAAAMLLIADGKWDKTEWKPTGGNAWYTHGNEDDAKDSLRRQYTIRPKPEPRVRDWSKPQDIPGPGPCYIRSATALLDQWSMIVSAGPRGFQIAADGTQTIVEWESVEDFRHSTDLNTWHKCEVTEEAP